MHLSSLISSKTVDTSGIRLVSPLPLGKTDLKKGNLTIMNLCTYQCHAGGGETGHGVGI